MTDLRELIGATIKESRTRQAETHGNDHDNDDVAGDVLSALDAAGIVCVPRIPTPEMAEASAGWMCHEDTFYEVWDAALSVSPYAKGEKE